MQQIENVLRLRHSPPESHGKTPGIDIERLEFQRHKVWVRKQNFVPVEARGHEHLLLHHSKISSETSSRAQTEWNKGLLHLFS